MFLIFGVLGVLTMAGLSTGEICPPAEALYPCICSEFYPMINCQAEEITTTGVFQTPFEYVNNEAELYELSIFNTDILEIGGALERLKFKSIQIFFNRNLRHISPSAFIGSRNITTELELSISSLGNEAVNIVSGFEKLQTLDLYASKLTTIPDNMLQNLSSLESVNLAYNNIFSIGKRAFATGTNRLERVFLSNNSLTLEGLSEDTFEGISRAARVYLDCNNIEFMEQKIFEILLDRAYRVWIGGSRCGHSVNSIQRFPCNERSDWICNKEERYRPKLHGYRCKNDSGFVDIWEYCAGREVTTGNGSQNIHKPCFSMLAVMIIMIIRIPDLDVM